MGATVAALRLVLIVSLGIVGVVESGEMLLTAVYPASGV